MPKPPPMPVSARRGNAMTRLSSLLNLVFIMFNNTLGLGFPNIYRRRTMRAVSADPESRGEGTQFPRFHLNSWKAIRLTAVFILSASSGLLALKVPTPTAQIPDWMTFSPLISIILAIFAFLTSSLFLVRFTEWPEDVHNLTRPLWCIALAMPAIAIAWSCLFFFVAGIVFLVHQVLAGSTAVPGVVSLVLVYGSESFSPP
ncbi:hypothetical protein AMATHDRAFT_5396 [Amanita thiersii Skay4041]|uniref:Uncharacterized protein n=1 Tax=Amanita thiersii Skay4041 TaxID=703135 RepID=A0A2A9NHS1_9AGAR|nr:hypothetical protein AMATHDRAFT_5396 [Amanita thiersii Skay4041]